MRRATKDTEAGRRYLDLQREAKRTGRPTDELIQLYALEGFLDRLTRSEFASNFVLKGGVLLAALDARRPTRDIDLAAHAFKNTKTETLRIVRRIAEISLDDGLRFDSEHAAAESIRETDSYGGVRITLRGKLERAEIRLHVDVNIGDPIWPEPQQIRLPRLLHGELLIRGYPLEMVLAEKIITALERGTANTRWRDFLDIYVLVRRHSIDGQTLRASMQRVAQHRDVALVPLGPELAGYAAVAQQRWGAWLRRHHLDRTAPVEFSAILEVVIPFADHAMTEGATGGSWNPVEGKWG